VWIVTQTDTPTISIDIYSDVVCPWCYIGKRRFEAGMALVEADHLDVNFEITFKPFQLDPTAAPGVAGPVLEAYAKKFGGLEQAQEILARVTDAAKEEGLEFNMDRALRANTLLAHRLIWFADQPASQVDQEVMKERLLKAYFTDGLNIGDPDTLANCAAEVGFDRDEVIAFLESDRGVSEVSAELEEASQNGITAVPTYVLDGMWAVPGAQDPETFEKVLRKIAAKATSGE
jgi:predicted DsbA family dithiol-disulfide isomerase